jgi:hypothetical protein
VASGLGRTPVTALQGSLTLLLRNPWHWNTCRPQMQRNASMYSHQQTGDGTTEPFGPDQLDSWDEPEPGVPFLPSPAHDSQRAIEALSLQYVTVTIPPNKGTGTRATGTRCNPMTSLVAWTTSCLTSRRFATLDFIRCLGLRNFGSRFYSYRHS